MKTVNQKALDLFLTIDKDDTLLRWMHCAMQVQALLCIVSVEEFEVLEQTIKNHPYGFEDDYKNALLALLDKGKNYDLP